MSRVWAWPLLLVLSACSSTGPCYEAGAPAGSLRTIYVVERGWHTGVVVATADWPNRDWRVLSDFPDVDYLEFGWGDERFYQAEKNTPWLGSRAALWPTSSVIHVIGLEPPISSTVESDELVAVRVSERGLRRLTASIEQEFAEKEPSQSGPETELAPKPNRFYQAKRSFFFPRMCNWWIAARLQEAGCPIQPATVVTASRVMRDARRFSGEVATIR